MRTPGRSAAELRTGARLGAPALALAVLAAALSVGYFPPARAETVAIADAIRSGKAEEVRTYIEEHRGDINRPLEEGLPLISIAVNAGRRDIVQLLLDQGAAVDAPDEVTIRTIHGGQTALDHAAWHDFDDIAALLLSHGASLERGAAPFSPLQYAAAQGSIKVATLLLQKGANPDALDSNGDQPPLSLAAFGNRPGIVDLLIANKANLETNDRSGRTPLGVALMYGRPEISQKLLDRGAKCNGLDHSGSTTLYIAAAATGWPTQESEIAVISRLLACGLDVNAATANGETALLAALRSHRPGVAEFILSKGAAPHGSAAWNGQHALHLAAAIDGAAPLLAELIGKGADVKARDRTGNTPFLVAAQQGSLQNMQVLLAHGASIDESDTLGRTALHLLAAGPKIADPKIAEFLLASGANVQARTLPSPYLGGDDSLTPLHVAAQSNQTELMKLLLAHGADIDALTTKGETPLTAAIANDRPDAARLLLERGAKVEGIPGKSPAPLFVSVAKNELQVARLLLEYRADVNGKRPGTGESALFAAAKAGEAEMVRLLLAHGACVACADRAGRTPLHAAADANHEEVVALLLQGGADINATDAAGITALEGAKDASMQQYLLAHGAKGSPAPNPQTYQSACGRVAEKASAGRLRELLGEPVDGEKLKQSPRNDWNDDALRWADSWFTINTDGGKFVLGEQDQQIRYLAVLDADNVEEPVCTFTQRAPSQRITQSRNGPLCEAVMRETITYAPYDHLHGLSYGSLSKDARWPFTSPGDKAARIDLDNDGKVDSIVELQYSSSHGEGCDYSYPAFLNGARTEIDVTRTEPIMDLSLACGDQLRPFEFENAAYLDWKPQPTVEARDRTVLKLQGGQLETICKIGTHSTYSAVPIVPASGR